MFFFYLLLAKLGIEFSKSGTENFPMIRLKNAAKIGQQFVQIGPRFSTLENPNFESLYNILHLDSKFVMMST
jgi:hypothetical protein